MNTPHTLSEFRRGIKEAAPIIIGMIPFALILGAQAVRKGMSWLETILMMGLNFAGGSEFAAVGLWHSPLPVLLIIGTTLLINSRHILMGIAFIPFIRHLPLKQLLPALFVMTDESWAMSLTDARKRQKAGLPAFSLPYYFGTALPLYALWVSCGFIGARFGYLLGNVEKLGFGMAFPAVFLVLIRSMWTTWRAAVPWLVSLVVAAASYLMLPHSGWYVLFGTFAGLLAASFGQGGEVE
ncbi:AzlC family ABC transporter permease [Eikenella sp. Marseille-P7795]|uniref:AzlC family ABC transporter permease n=1 Tax=Eikenella sp. Marseille-P7795 TaxID=2866577 RepID=UPI001CE3ED5C|nr:AzlC family ABC transporter permease [Eikenella sp. Marseille-P7795]